MENTFNTNHGVETPIEAIVEVVIKAGRLHHEATEDWKVAPGCDPLASRYEWRVTASARRSRWLEVAVDMPAGLAHLILRPDQNLRVHCYGSSPERAEATLARVREAFPQGENPDETVVPVTFWTYSPHGARQVLRDIDANEWSEIEENYTEETRTALAGMMNGFRPGIGGQLVLWHGVPGTGKTTALRALAREWREWATIHYVVDPERFFGAHADYMMDVMMADSEMAILVGPDGEEEKPVPQWRVLVLEDCGEMLAIDAKEKTGAALARFLNACDGLIGRGLRVLILVTTNEPLEKQHPAVSRPGRCAAKVEFEQFSVAQAREWLRANDAIQTHATHPRTLADLYALKSGFESEPESVMGFA